MTLRAINQLTEIKPENAIWMKSSCEPFCEEMDLDEGRKKNWLEHFGIKEYFAHASGHASGDELKEMICVLDLNPEVGMVLGDRFSKTYEKESDRNQFYVGNRILGFAQRMINGVKLNDPYTGLRLIRFELLKGWKPRSSGFDIEAELNHRIDRLGYKIVELPIKYRKRLGKKKLSFRHGLKILRRIVIESLTSQKCA